MELTSLLKDVETTRLVGSRTLDVGGLAYDSRQVQPGWLFAALKGEKLDGNDFITQVAEQGACAVLSEQAPRSDVPLTWVQVPAARRALAQMAASFYGHPARTVRVVGVTGTNGKTTTVYLLHSILEAAGYKAGLFGTIHHQTVAGGVSAVNTTPESLDLHRFLAEWRDAGAQWAVMEVSSHGLAFERVYGVTYAAALFTNLAGDHLDYHKTMENYFEAKQQLFLGQGTEPPGISVLNSDDPYGRRLRDVCKGKVLFYGIEDQSAEVAPQDVRLTFTGTEFTLRTPTGSISIRSSLAGRSNLCNLVAAGAVSFALGISPEAIAAGIEKLDCVPGRFERVNAGQPFMVVVDFAHTDLAFTNLLTTARELTKGRVIIVFGSGGDRDRSKRPMMGEIAARLADFVVLTTDNPRSEDPACILHDIVVGAEKAGGRYEIVEDREAAFQRAFEMAQAGDMVLLVGKGHQDTQVFAGWVEPWSERDAALRALASLGFREEEVRRSQAS